MWLVAIIANNAENRTLSPSHRNFYWTAQLQGFQQQDGTIQGFLKQLGQKISVGRTPGDVILNYAGEGWGREGGERKQVSDPPQWSVIFPHNHNLNYRGEGSHCKRAKDPSLCCKHPSHGWEKMGVIITSGLPPQ